MGRLMVYIGEKAFTRPIPANGVYIDYLKCVFKNKKWQNVVTCFYKSNVYRPGTKEKEIKKSLAYFKRLNLIKSKRQRNTLVLTKLGNKILNSKSSYDKNESFSKIDFNFFKAIFLWNKAKKIYILKNILKIIGDNSEQNISTSWKEVLRVSQPKKRLKLLKDNFKNLSNDSQEFASYLTWRKNEENKLKEENEIYKFWKKWHHFTLKCKINYGLHEKIEYIELLDEYKNLKINNKSKHHKFILFFKNKLSKKPNWVNKLTKNDFIKEFSEEKMQEKMLELIYYYSEESLLNITWQNINLSCKFINKNDKLVWIEEKKYIHFLDKLIKKWTTVVAKIHKDPLMSFDEFLKILNLQKEAINNRTLKNKKTPTKTKEEKIAIYKKKLENGQKAEEIFIEWLKKNGYKNWSHDSRKWDNLGYDVSCFDKYGKKVFFEVKAINLRSKIFFMSKLQSQKFVKKEIKLALVNIDNEEVQVYDDINLINLEVIKFLCNVKNKY